MSDEMLRHKHETHSIVSIKYDTKEFTAQQPKLVEADMKL
jgi:hypothetical protein